MAEHCFLFFYKAINHHLVFCLLSDIKNISKKTCYLRLKLKFKLLTDCKTYFCLKSWNNIRKVKRQHNFWLFFICFVSQNNEFYFIKLMRKLHFSYLMEYTTYKRKKINLSDADTKMKFNRIRFHFDWALQHSKFPDLQVQLPAQLHCAEHCWDVQLQSMDSKGKKPINLQYICS